ncbi:MAG: hypothetical protein NVSMB7_11420 [Chitinophagaceae bacterium]
MSKLGRIFITGFIVSFLGSLPLGTLNVAAMQIAVSDGVRQAFLFAAGALTSEVIYVRLSLIAMDWIRKQQRLLRILEWVTVAIVLALALSSFYAATHPGVHKNIILSSSLNMYWLGLIMCALSPVQIPFWFGWSTVLFTKKILLPLTSHYYFYIIGIGLGTMAGNCVFIFGGRYIVDKLNTNENKLHWIVGSVFLVTAIIQLWRMFKHKDAIHQMQHPEEANSHGLAENILTKEAKPKIN